MPVKIIGTSHIAKESIETVKRVIEETKPDCVAIELDPKRFYALTHAQQAGEKRKLGLRFGLTIYLFGWLQQKLGKAVGVLPGSEMLAAIESAKSVNAKIVLIDRDIEETFRGIMGAPLREKLKLFLGIFAAPFSSGKINLKKVPNERIIEQAVRYMKKELPGFYKALIGDRNRYMAAWIKKLEGEFENVVVVVGAGHKKELERMIRKK
ncbi:MAG: TraB domain-containing protein [Nanoarchaeota archaeon]|nr:TraB domain-containing protein [Nanoarchaeota archaeon]